MYYDYGEQRIKVLAKLHNYLKAKSGKGDYDVISFKSQVPAKYNAKMQINAALNLKTKDLNVLGVPEIILSDSQKVYMFPTGGRIVIKQNRDFVFSGQIAAGNGRFNLFGKDFYFHYSPIHLCGKLRLFLVKTFKISDLKFSVLLLITDLTLFLI